MEMEQAVSALRARSEELKASGPGRVEVAKIHNIEDVQVLRACRATLTQSETFEIRQAVIELESYLVGIEEATAPPADDSGGRLRKVLGGLLTPLSLMAASAGKAAREEAQWQHMTSAAGGPAKLPPPKALLDAAESWLVGQVAADRVDVDTSIVTRPWLTATVTPSS